MPVAWCPPVINCETLMSRYSGVPSNLRGRLGGGHLGQAVE